MDYSKLSNDDLLALKSQNYSKLSNEGLIFAKQLQSEQQKAQQQVGPQPGQPAENQDKQKLQSGAIDNSMQSHIPAESLQPKKSMLRQAADMATSGAMGLGEGAAMGHGRKPEDWEQEAINEHPDAYSRTRALGELGSTAVMGKMAEPLLAGAKSIASGGAEVIGNAARSIPEGLEKLIGVGSPRAKNLVQYLQTFGKKIPSALESTGAREIGAGSSAGVELGEIPKNIPQSIEEPLQQEAKIELGTIPKQAPRRVPQSLAESLQPDAKVELGQIPSRAPRSTPKPIESPPEESGILTNEGQYGVQNPKSSLGFTPAEVATPEPMKAPPPLVGGKPSNRPAMNQSEVPPISSGESLKDYFNRIYEMPSSNANSSSVQPKEQPLGRYDWSNYSRIRGK